MSFWNKFTNFDPLTGNVPPYANVYTDEIVWRARQILKVQNRSSKDIDFIAQDIGDEIDQFFSNEKANIIQTLVDNKQFDFLELDDSGRPIDLTWEAEQEYDVRTSDNTADFDALREGLDSYANIKENICMRELVNFKLFEHFATLSLCKIVDYLERFDWEVDPNTRQLIKRSGLFTKADHEISANLLIAAMEAVSYAERLQYAERLESKYELKTGLNNLNNTIQSDLDREAFRRQIESELKAEEAQKKTEKGRAMNKASQVKRNESMSKALEYYDQSSQLQLLSNNKAAAELSNWLITRKLKTFDQIAIARWISAHKRAKNND
jgi:hypothetical protein